MMSSIKSQRASVYWCLALEVAWRNAQVDILSYSDLNTQRNFYHASQLMCNCFYISATLVLFSHSWSAVVARELHERRTIQGPCRNQSSVGCQASVSFMWSQELSKRAVSLSSSYELLASKFAWGYVVFDYVCRALRVLDLFLGSTLIARQEVCLTYYRLKCALSCRNVLIALKLKR